jgi:hypothetical protein
MPWCFSRLGLAIVWQRATRSLWCATLFRDIHTAVDAGNVLIRGNFRAERKNFRVATNLMQKKPAMPAFSYHFFNL